MSRTFLGGLTNRVLMTIAAACLVLSFLSSFINPAEAWFLMLPGLLFVPLALLNLFLLVWAVFRRSKAFVIPLVALLPTMLFLGRYFRFSSGAADGEGGVPVRIVSYNVGRFAMQPERSGIRDRKACADSVFSFLDDCDADIICLQEYCTDDNTSVRKELSGRFPGYSIEYYMYSGRAGHFGNVILSRFPIADKGVLKFDKSANLAVYADIVGKHGRFRIYNCHFESYNISLPGIVKSVEEMRNDVFRETEEKMKRSLSRRPRQVEQVMGHIASCAYETVLCGDFNDNPTSYTYQRLIKGHDDTFCRAGKGFGATYAALWPLLRIDYIFMPDGSGTCSHKTPKIRFSDHYPVIADVCFPDGEGGHRDTRTKEK